MTAGQASHKRSYDRLYVERKRKERLAEGKCIACGSPERKVKKDGSFAQKCPSCASKALKRTKKFKAHDENQDCNVGDLVRIRETRPLSRTKRWRLVEIVKRAD